MNIVEQIWGRVQELFPALKKVSLESLSQEMKIRIGFCPYSKFLSETEHLLSSYILSFSLPMSLSGSHPLNIFVCIVMAPIIEGL